MENFRERDCCAGFYFYFYFLSLGRRFSGLDVYKTGNGNGNGNGEREGGRENIFGVSWLGNFFIFYILGGQALRPIWEMFLVKKKVNAIFITAVGFLVGRLTTGCEVGVGITCSEWGSGEPWFVLFCFSR